MHMQQKTKKGLENVYNILSTIKKILDRIKNLMGG